MIGYVISPNGTIKEKIFNDNNVLNEIQNEVNGYTETLTYLNEKVVIIVNDEGKLLGLAPTCYIKRSVGIDLLVGNVVILGILNNDFCSISENKAISFIKKYMII